MNFPLDLRFKILAIASQIAVTDAQGQLVFYVKQKAFKLKEAVTVFADESQTRPLYKIVADRILDISARYRIEDQGGAELGILQRRGMRSLWKAHYEIHQGGRQAFLIREENGWVKVLDAIVGGIPILGMFAGYMFNPAYLVSRGEGQPALLRVAKQPAMLEGKFRIDAVAPAQDQQADLAVLGVLMMLLLERARG
jgi:hypothetical protein